MNEAPVIIKQSDLDGIAAQLRVHSSLAVVLSLFEEINRGRTVQIIENGAVVFEANSCDELSNHIRSRAQAVPEDSRLLENRAAASEPGPGQLQN